MGPIQAGGLAIKACSRKEDGMKAFVLVWCAALAMASGARGETLMVLVHKRLLVGAVSRQEISRIFLGQSRELSSARVAPVVVATSGNRTDILSQLTGRTPAAIGDHFVRLELRAEGRWPHQVDHAGELVRRILESAEIPGRPSVVGCVALKDYEALTPKQKEVVVPLAIDGTLPGESGYPLK